MDQIGLGTQGFQVSRQGLGCMGISEFYGESDLEESSATMKRALELGVTFFDTSDAYGPFTNEEFVGEALREVRDRVQIATKFGIVRDPSNPSARGLNGTPDYVAAACEASLRRLGVDHVDLYYLHRVDPETPIEETVGAMAKLVVEGKVRYLGLSEAAPETIRRAHATHPITALQTEYSIWAREPEQEIIPTLHELGIGFVPYSPLGRGFLSGTLSLDALGEKDFRRFQPRLVGDNLQQNTRVIDNIAAIAKTRSVSSAQIALAWVYAKCADFVPIPGTRHVKYLESNAAAVDTSLTAEEIGVLDSFGTAVGDRYTDTSSLNR